MEERAGEGMDGEFAGENVRTLLIGWNLSVDYYFRVRVFFFLLTFDFLT